MGTEATMSWEFRLRADNARLLVIICIDIWVNIAEMLYKVIFPEARLHVLDAFAGAKAANP